MNLLKRLVTFLPRKVVYAAAGLALAAVSAAYPDVPLPSAEAVTAITLAIIGGHAITDIASLVLAAIVEAAKLKHAGRGQRGPASGVSKKSRRR